MLASPMLMSPIDDFLVMSGFEPRELAVKGRRAINLATQSSSQLRRVSCGFNYGIDVT